MSCYKVKYSKPAEKFIKKKQGDRRSILQGIRRIG